MKYYQAIFTLLLLCSPAFAEAKAVISGPSEVLVNNLFFLSTEGSIGDNTQWILPDMSQAQEAVCGTTKFIVINRPGRYELILIAADKQANISYVRHTVTVRTSLDPSPGPVDPIPDPKPEPDPAPPIGEFDNLLKVSKAGATTLADQPTALMLANAINTAIESTPATTPMATATASMGKTIEAALLSREGVSRTKDWLNLWRKPVNEELLKLSAAGRVTTTAAYFDAMRAVMAGLR